MLDSYKPGVSRLSQRGASAPSLTSQFYKYRYAAAFSAAPQFQALHLCTIIGSGQTPAASRAKNPAIFYQCFQGDFLIFCCLAQKSCPPCFSGTPCLRRKFQMAEKYTEPLWRAGAAFSATPGDGGLPPRMGIACAQATTNQPRPIAPCTTSGGELTLPDVRRTGTPGHDITNCN